MRQTEMKLKLIHETSATNQPLYRTDSGIDHTNIDHYKQLLATGKYDGRYFTSKPHDACIYYTNNKLPPAREHTHNADGSPRTIYTYQSKQTIYHIKPHR